MLSTAMLEVVAYIYRLVAVIKTNNMKITKLFSDGQDWWYNAIIKNDSEYGNKWESYAVGYKLAADTLAKKVISECDNRDTLVFPIVFLYRHYFELRLKEIIQHGSTLIDEEVNVPKHHDLMILWTEVKKIIKKIWPESSDKDLAHISSIMIEFVNIDKLSDAFRYPVNKSGAPTLEGINYINIFTFLENITPVANDLEGMACGISVYEEYKSEMLSDYYSYMRREM
jgi:hypothetical protein